VGEREGEEMGMERGALELKSLFKDFI